MKRKKKRKKNDILLQRILLSLGILIFIRIGTFLPVPGVDHGQLNFFIQRHLFTRTLLNTFSSSNTLIIGIFTLNIFPYINASILMQLFVNFFPELAKAQKEGSTEGKQAISLLTRIITFGWAFIQSLSIAFYLKRALFGWNLILATEIVIWLTTGAMIVLWLSEIITEYGIGNGSSLLIFTNIISSFPNLIKRLILENDANLNFKSYLIIILLLFIAIFGIIFLQESARIIPLISSKQLNTPRNILVESVKNNYLPLRFNQAGVMPIILTTTVLVIPSYISSLTLGVVPIITLPFLIRSSKIIYWLSYFLLIVIFSSIYSTIVLNPKDLSEQLQKMAVTIPGIRPGIATRIYLQQIIKRITFIGAIILAALATLPNIIEGVLNISSFNGLGTTSLLILVGVILDVYREVKSILLSNIYNKMLK
jgi:preprotein translocase subunit SecY